MRKVMLAILAFAAIGAGTIAGSAPAAAYDYPWCAQGKAYGIPGECSYQTYEQCRLSVSGRDLYCGVNPRVAFDRQPPRRERRQRNYYND